MDAALSSSSAGAGGRGYAPTSGKHLTGTTIVGVCYDGGVVLGADSRTSTDSLTPAISGRMASSREGSVLPLSTDTKQEGVVSMQAKTSSSSTSSDQAKSMETDMHPLLRASACFGSWRALKYLFNTKNEKEITMAMPTDEFIRLLNSTVYQASDDEDAEQGLDQHASVLLGGVTVEGDTALHVLASHGDDENFLECASIIYGKASHLLLVQNKNGETPLHCAARAGKSQMVSRLIGFVCVDSRKEFVRKENVCRDTALHEAVRVGSLEIVRCLMQADSELACFPIHGGCSPLYLAISMRKGGIADMLYKMSKGNLSYSGLNGLNALHAAVIAGQGFTKKLLEQNKDLTTQADEKGSTPLHFAAALFGERCRGSECRQVLEANPAALCRADKDGSFPIHVAASLGEWWNIKTFLEVSPSSAALRDGMGRTFLHVATKERKRNIVLGACRTRSLVWILNMQDNNGCTALHLAVEVGDLATFCDLFGNRGVQLNLADKKGQTPLDIAKYKIPPGFYFDGVAEATIRYALLDAGARIGVVRRDHFTENYKEKHQVKAWDQSKELEKIREYSQSLCIGAVLISTVTFGATFALPGGYRADDHPNGGTPTLAGSHAFDAFMIANTLAFVCSSVATVSLMYSGNPLVNLEYRQFYAVMAFNFMRNAITCLVATFALGAYAVLAPVAHKTAAAVCVVSPLVLIGSTGGWITRILVTPSLYARKGAIWSLQRCAYLALQDIVFDCWPLIFIFVWAARPRNHPNAVSGTNPVQPPVPWPGH